VLLAIWGVWAFYGLTIEAFPDPTDTQVQIITSNPGQPAEEMERQVNIPIECERDAGPRAREEHHLFGLSLAIGDAPVQRGRPRWNTWLWLNQTPWRLAAPGRRAAQR
jgi:hypothetical protein